MNQGHYRDGRLPPTSAPRDRAIARFTCKRGISIARVRFRALARAPLPRKIVGGKASWLLARRSATEDPGGYVLYRAWGPEGTTLAELARIARTGRLVEEDLERARDEVGLDRYEVRRWEAWHRHVTLSLLAHAALQVARAR